MFVEPNDEKQLAEIQPLNTGGDVEVAAPNKPQKQGTCITEYLIH